jgi:hypothetical protein
VAGAVVAGAVVVEVVAGAVVAGAVVVEVVAGAAVVGVVVAAGVATWLARLGPTTTTTSAAVAPVIPGEAGIGWTDVGLSPSAAATLWAAFCCAEA